jgi:hypothetical protein
MSDYTKKDERLQLLNRLVHILEEQLENQLEYDDKGKRYIDPRVVKQIADLLKEIAVELGEIPKSTDLDTGESRKFELSINGINPIDF